MPALTASLSGKRFAAAVLSLLLVAVAFASRRPKQVFLFGWILSLTYNRQYFGAFDAVFGDNGSQGLYWIPADPFLLALLVLWAAERRADPRARPHGASLLPYLLPFAAACLASALAAERVDWGLFEMARLVRLVVILAYVRFNLGPAEWLVCIAAFGCAVLAQSSLALLQAALNVGSGLSALLGGGLQEGDLSVTLGGRAQARGAGTMAHPNVLAPYLLLLVPVFVALAVTARERVLRFAAAVTALVGLAGIAATLSRLPMVVVLAELLATILALAAVGAIQVRRAFGLVTMGGLVLLLAAAPLAGRIRERFVSDFKESVELRGRYNEAAFQMAKENPFLGVGLNGFRTQLGRYIPEFEEMLEKGEERRLETGLRVTAPVHNFYLLVLSETGILGLATLGVFLAAVVARGSRAVVASEGAGQGMCVGLLVGLLGQLVQQLGDFSLWTDPLLYTFALIAAMLGVAASGGAVTESPGTGRAAASPDGLSAP